MPSGIAAFYTVLKMLLYSIHIHRWQKLTIREMRNTIVGTANAYKLLYVAVPGCNILVADWPVYTNALLCISFKIKIAPALCPACPHERFTTSMITSYPCERLVLYIRMLIIFYKEMLCGFAKGIALAFNRI